LNNLNGPIKAPQGMNLLTKFQPDPTVDDTAAAIRKYSSSIETLKTLLQCEMNISLSKQLLKDPNGKIEVTQSMNLLTKFQPDLMVNKVLGVVESCWEKLFISTLFSFSFLSLFLLLAAVTLFEKYSKG